MLRHTVIPLNVFVLRILGISINAAGVSVKPYNFSRRYENHL